MTFLVNVQDLAFEDLIETNLLTRKGLEAAQHAVKRDGGTVADWLFSLGLVGERDLLRALAHRIGRQYATLHKVASLRVDGELLSRVPVRLCERHEVMPFRIDAEGTLWVISASAIANEDLVDELRGLTRAQELNNVLALGAVVRAAIKRHYYAQSDAFEHATRTLPGARVGSAGPSSHDLSLVTGLKCPACGEPVNANAFQCAACLLLLNEDEVQSVEASEVISIVQGMLLPVEQWPQTRDAQAPAASDSHGSTKEVLELKPHTVPEIIAPLDQVGTLQPYEAGLLVHVDGVKTVGEIAVDVGLSALELGFALGGLKLRGIVDVHERVPTDPLHEPHVEQLEGDSRRALQLAVSLELVGEWQAAVKALVTGIGRLKQPAPLLNKLALLLIARNRDYAAAVDLLQRAVDLEPTVAVYVRNLEKVRRKLGR